MIFHAHAPETGCKGCRFDGGISSVCNTCSRNCTDHYERVAPKRLAERDKEISLGLLLGIVEVNSAYSIMGK